MNFPYQYGKSTALSFLSLNNGDFICVFRRSSKILATAIQFYQFSLIRKVIWLEPYHEDQLSY